jgi:hypothetical protein
MVDSFSDHKQATASLNQLLNWYLNDSGNAGKDQPWLISQLIPDSFRGFNSLLENLEPAPGPTAVLNFSSITKESWYSNDAWFTETIDELTTMLEGGDIPSLIGPCILHGSMAAGDYSLGWSDFDIFAVVSNAVIRDPAKILELRQLAHDLRGVLERSTPLQHHGVQFAAESSLGWFDNAALPTAALELGKSLRATPESISVHPVFDKQSPFDNLNARTRLFESAASTGELRHHACDGEFLLDDFQNADNGLYQLKYLLDVCTLAPAITIAATGTPIDKSSALSQLHGKISPSNWKIINAATLVRSQWPDREGLDHADNYIPAWVQTIVGPDYFNDALALHVACVEYVENTGIN